MSFCTAHVLYQFNFPTYIDLLTTRIPKWSYILVKIEYFQLRLVVYFDRILWSDSNFIPMDSKKFELRISTRPWESTSKMSQKPKIWGPMTFKKCSQFSVQSLGTLTHNCGKPVVHIKILTGASERRPRDLPMMV